MENFLLCDTHLACLLAFDGDLHAILSMSWLQKVHSRSGKQVHNIYYMQETGTGGNKSWENRFLPYSAGDSSSSR